ncbi:hypothetical protein F4810DRAFT_643247 [Camillea tinctor]|nr:hypothetical protein F4810DRAFT_643247 [Camillea tinctor]
MAAELPTVRWGIIATGLISSWFVKDLMVERTDKRANHIIKAVGSSSQQKGTEFVQKHLSAASPIPVIYGSYEEVYNDPNVDVVYIGTPHAFHKQNCLDAIKHGKHVLCEKAFTINSAEAREVFEAAKEKGVFVMEAMWTRFFPLTRKLLTLLHSEKVIGDVRRVFCDFAMDQKIASLGPESRLKNPALGAGSLLDIGIYSLTWALLCLDTGLGEQAEKPKIAAMQTLIDEIDTTSSALLLYPGRQGVVTCSTLVKGRSPFCRIEGSEGSIEIEGFTSCPQAFTIHKGDNDTKKYEFEKPGMGFFWEADAVALDITAGKTQDNIMPWSETVRVLEIMDEIRRQGGAKFPQDAA